MFTGKKMAATALPMMGLLAASMAQADELTVRGEVTDSPCYIASATASEANALVIESMADATTPERPFKATLDLPKMRTTATSGKTVNVMFTFAGGTVCGDGSNQVRIYTQKAAGYYAGDTSVAMNQLPQGAQVSTGVGIEVLQGGTTAYDLSTNPAVAIGSGASTSYTQTWGFRLKKPATSTETVKKGKVETTFDIEISST